MPNKNLHSVPLIEGSDAEYAKRELQNYYAEDFIPPDKKTYLVNLRKGQGPYLAISTAEGKTRYMMDAASQIASLGLGFNASIFMGTAHFQEAWTNDFQGEHFLGLRSGFQNFLKRQTSFEHITMLLCNSGSVANETALGLCYRRRKHQQAHKILAFEGSFHGRTLLSLFSTWSPSKREPFQIPGLETTFCPYPELEGSEMQCQFPEKWRKFWEHAPDSGQKVPSEWLQEGMLEREVKALLQVRSELSSQKFFAIIIEPMQCEGGDRYSSDRFHTALLLMAKSFQVPLIYDEIQTGFHLGRTFFWHRGFNLLTSIGKPLYPDYITCAKKSQSGLVISSHSLELSELEKDQHFQVASLVRGYQHALALEQSGQRIEKLEEEATKRLAHFVQTYAQFIERPRAQGLAFAFDFKDADLVKLFVKHRFDYGLLYYPAGERTLRFRLNTAFSASDFDFLFERLDALAQKIFLNRNEAVPETLPISSGPFGKQVDDIYQWHEMLMRMRWNKLHGKDVSESKLLDEIGQLMRAQGKLQEGEKIVVVDGKNFSRYDDLIQELQKISYEPARQTGRESFAKTASSAFGLSLLLESKEVQAKGRELKAISFSSLPQDHPQIRGIRQDPYWHDDESLYALDTTVHPNHRNLGLGRPMKYALAILAINRGAKRIQGRNRDRVAASMLSINLSLGAYEQCYLKEDYLDFETYRDVIYYTSPLQWKKLRPSLSDRIDAPLGLGELDCDYLKEQLPCLNNKICLSNFVSLRFLEYLKAVGEQAPTELRHFYSASGQSECVDKIFKSLWHKGRCKKRLLTFSGHIFGNETFLARALSGESTSLFDVDILPEENLSSVEALLDQHDYMAVWIEPVRQRDLVPVVYDFLKGLKTLLKNRGIPLIYNETAAQMFSWSDQHYFASNDSDLTPNASFAFLGGQSAVAMLEKDIFVKEPLMMISTWDGDEFSLAQYCRAMKRIVSDPKRFFDVREKFHQELERVLSRYPIQSQLKNGRGTFCGALPLPLQHFFRSRGSFFVVDPSYAQMERFLSLKDEI